MVTKFLKMAFAFVAIAGFTAITGCKKGENDPFLSLKSRKARISGEWKLTDGIVTQINSDGVNTDTYVTTFTETTATVDGNSISYTQTLTIDKDGTYEVVIVEDGDTYTISGNWYFSGKSKDIDLKKKEAIIFSETKYVSSSGSDTYQGLYADEIILIDQLKNKELIFKGLVTYDNIDGFTASYEYDRTFTKQ